MLPAPQLRSRRGPGARARAGDGGLALPALRERRRGGARPGARQPAGASATTPSTSRRSCARGATCWPRRRASSAARTRGGCPCLPLCSSAPVRSSSRPSSAARRLASDARWKALAGAGLAELPGQGIGGLPIEVCDARLLPEGWNQLDFDDGAWPAAAELSAASIGFTGRHEPPSHPYGPLLPRPIPLLGCVPREPRTVRSAGAAPAADVARGDPVDQALADLAAAAALEEVQLPLALPEAPGAAHVVCVDFGEVVAGTVVIELDAPAGTRVDAAASRVRRRRGRPRPAGERGGLRYLARGAGDRFESFAPHGLRHLALSIRAPGPLTLRKVAVNERLQPRPSGPFFECSDPLLEPHLGGGAAHRRPLLAGRLPRLPHPRAARLDRRLRRPPDGRLREPPGLEPRALERGARRVAAPRRDAPDGRRRRHRARRHRLHPRLGAPLGARALEPLALHRRPRGAWRG